MRGISKRFPGVVALDRVDLEVGQGEVVALCGENGAGKSTLVKILGGVCQPDEGEILVDGRPVRITGVIEAMRLGIAFIHQELNVLDNLDVAANVFLGREPRLGLLPLIDRRKIHADTAPLLRRLGLDIPTTARLDRLSLAQQQMVEIAKALSLDARVIIMDEPTSSLTLTETERLLALIAELRGQGVSVIFISHRLGEVDRSADRVVVLRDGRNAGELGSPEITHDNIVRLMIGRDIRNLYVASPAETTPAYLNVRELRSSRYPGTPVSFDAGRGEILGLAGLVGAGRSELAKAMVGLDAGASGTVTLGGESVPIRDAWGVKARGIYLVPEDRRAEGLVVGMTVRENVTLPSLDRYSVLGLIRRARERVAAEAQIASLAIKTPSVETVVANLSGGNQQKVVLGKWLSLSPKVLILDEPTRGVDVGAKAEIYRLTRDLAGRGAVVLMISSDMEEILHMSDRVAVMHEGRITGVLDREYCTEENVMNLAVGRAVDVSRPAMEG
jgi:ribose transport system ATP-binding protein